MVLFERSETGIELVFDGVKTIEGQVVEVLLAQLVPDMLDGIQFESVRRQRQQPHIGGHTQRPARMPTGPVRHHHDVLIGVAGGHLIEEDLHARGIHARQDQGVQFATGDLHGHIGVGVFVREHRPDTPAARRQPAGHAAGPGARCGRG